MYVKLIQPILIILIDKSKCICGEATLVQRGLQKDQMSNLKELEGNATDVAIIRLLKQAVHLNVDDHFDPKFDLLPLSKLNPIPINSKLF